MFSKSTVAQLLSDQTAEGTQRSDRHAAAMQIQSA
jgi:hypothetical protein